MRLIITVFFSWVLFNSCNSGNDSPKDNTETNTTDSGITPPAEKETTTQIPGPKCFQNDGLQNKITVLINYFSAVDVGGTVAINDYNGKPLDKQRFNGTVKGNEISVRFMNKFPEVGGSSEWKDKPWTIRTASDGEVLRIVFNAKNFETNQWAEMAYELKQCATK
jgi:hypothetical protein